MEKKQNSFIWDPDKEARNIEKHHIDFATAARVFKDPRRKIFIDSKHSQREERYFCIGKIGQKVITVRFLCVQGKIRIIGAGHWRKGYKYYDQKKEN